MRSSPPRRSPFRDRDAPERDHIHLLRVYGDALAWRCLHPYSIRTLSKNAGKPPAISHQGDAFRQTLDIARLEAHQGVPPLVADLTHCLGIGDVITCADPERPQIHESGGHPRWLTRGRKGRQMRRALAAIDLLNRGAARFPDDAGAARVTFDVAALPEDDWPIVERVLREALKLGTAHEFDENGSLIHAADPDRPLDLPKPISKGPFCVGVASRRIDEPDPLVMPVPAWPIARSLRLALLEGDLELTHLVNMGAFVGREAHEARIIDLSWEGEFITGLDVDVGGESVTLNATLIEDVVYGFGTVASAAEQMLEFAVKSAAWQGGEIPDEPSDVIVVNTLDEARALLDLPPGDRPAHVVARGGLLETLAAEIGEPPDADASGPQPSFGFDRAP